MPVALSTYDLRVEVLSDMLAGVCFGLILVTVCLNIAFDC